MIKHTNVRDMQTQRPGLLRYFTFDLKTGLFYVRVKKWTHN